MLAIYLSLQHMWELAVILILQQRKKLQQLAKVTQLRIDRGRI